jgi:hypothetical protein
MTDIRGHAKIQDAARDPRTVPFRVGDFLGRPMLVSRENLRYAVSVADKKEIKMTSSTLELACKQIEFARGYTKSLLEDIDDDDWFRCPAEATTHLAWQIGHLAMAEYGLCLFRIRGRQPEDLELMSGAFRKKYSKGSAPDPEPSNNVPPGEILAVLDRVHARAMTELADCPQEVLQETVDEPYAVFNTKLGAVLFCSAHEMLHAGQIGLLRRLLGKKPIR